MVFGFPYFEYSVYTLGIILLSELEEMIDMCKRNPRFRTHDSFPLALVLYMKTKGEGSTIYTGTNLVKILRVRLRYHNLCKKYDMPFED